MSSTKPFNLRDSNGVDLDSVIYKLEQELEHTGEIHAVIKLEGGSAISFTLTPPPIPQPRPWWQVWRRK